MLDLYARTFDGDPLGADEYVLSADEKPGVQARQRIHPSRPPRPGRRPMLVESEYRRHGTLAYLAAYDVHHAQVIGHCAPTTGIEPFTALVTKVMTREPYASARRVFWIVDNGSSHRGWTAAARLADAFPNAVMVHTPVHASWLNQVEIYFSVVQRKLLTPTTSPASTSSPNKSPHSKPATTTPPDPSTGDSTATTSTGCSTGSPPDPRRTNGRDHPVASNSHGSSTLAGRSATSGIILGCRFPRRFRTEGVLFIGRAQEKTDRVPDRETPQRQPATPIRGSCRRPAMVNHFYFYAVDADFGPFFVKFCSYFPYTAKLWHLMTTSP